MRFTVISHSPVQSRFYLIIIIKSKVWPICHCLGLDNETMVCAVCLSICLSCNIQEADNFRVFRSVCRNSFPEKTCWRNATNKTDVWISVSFTYEEKTLENTNKYLQNPNEPDMCLMLTHWRRDTMADISQPTFSNAFSWMKIYEFSLEVPWSLFLSVEYSSIGSDNGLAPSRRQTIIWTSDGKFTDAHMRRSTWMSKTSHHFFSLKPLSGS